MALEVFITAARVGARLWAQWQDGRLEVCSGRAPEQAVSTDIGRLFVAALRERFGDVASSIAEREWRLGQRVCRLLPACRVHGAVTCAHEAQGLLMGRSQLLQFEFSAVLGGWRFLRVVAALNMDAALMSAERRRWLDQQLQVDFCADHATDIDAVSARLRTLLMHGMH